MTTSANDDDVAATVDANTTPIVLLHGLGARPLTLEPLRLYLLYCGYANVRTVEYPADTASLDECVDAVDAELARLFTRRPPLVVVGQSMGGVVGTRLHERGWTLRLLITIGSPLHGARLLNQVAAWLPTSIAKALMRPNYEHLMRCEHSEPPPPHPIHCITMSWMCVPTFDGCVYVDEAHYVDRPRTHLSAMDHRTGFANPRLWWAVAAAIKAQ